MRDMGKKCLVCTEIENAVLYCTKLQNIEIVYIDGLGNRKQNVFF